jgi:hypothetical protein
MAVKSCSDAAELRSTLPSASWKTLVISRRPTTLPSSLQTGYTQKEEVSCVEMIGIGIGENIN